VHLPTTKVLFCAARDLSAGEGQPICSAAYATNRRGEIVEPFVDIRDWGGRFVTLTPEPEILARSG
jgi:hypothetical protein